MVCTSFTELVTSKIEVANGTKLREDFVAHNLTIVPYLPEEWVFICGDYSSAFQNTCSCTFQLSKEIYSICSQCQVLSVCCCLKFLCLKHHLIYRCHYWKKIVVVVVDKLFFLVTARKRKSCCSPLHSLVAANFTPFLLTIWP